MNADSVQRYTLADLKADIATAVDLLGVPYDPDATNKVVDTFGDYFLTAPVSFRVTSKPVAQRQLSVRYLDGMQKHNAHEMALAAGLFEPTDHPVERIVSECWEKLPLLSCGVDMAVSHGFEKIWPVFAAPVSVEDLIALESMPRSLALNADHFARFNLTHVMLLAVDYWHRNVNLYFMTSDPAMYTPDTIAAMLEDLGMPVPSDEDLIASSKAGVGYHTLRWDSDEIERLCFAIPTFDPTEVPRHWSDNITLMVDQAPVRGPERRFIYNTTFSKRGDYYKLETDYNTGMVNALLACKAGAIQGLAALKDS